MFEYAVVRWAGGLLQQQLQEFSVILDSLPTQAWQRARVRNGCLIADNDNFPDPMDPLLALRGCGAFFAWPSRAGLKSHTLVVRPTPTGTLVLQCGLRAYRDTLQASFTTISGTSCVPTITLERRQVTLRCLTSKVHKLVVKGNQLASRQQKVRLTSRACQTSQQVMPSYGRDPSDEEPLNSDSVEKQTSPTQTCRTP